MANMLIVVNSRGGSTLRYMQELASRTGAELVTLKAAKASQLEAADTVVFASWLMAGSLSGGGFLKKHWRILKDRRTVLAVTGLGRTLEEKLWADYTARAFTREMRDALRVFYLRGAYDPASANAVVRKIMGMIGDSLLKKPEPTQDDRELCRGMHEGCDYVRMDNLSALESYLNS